MAAPGVVIVGAGECGGRAALTLRAAGYAGTITLVGAERHLPYERPPLSKEAMQAAEMPLPKAVVAEEQLKTSGIDAILANPATAIVRDARTVTLADGATLAYDNLLLATGARSRHLPLAGPGGERIAYLRTWEEAAHIRAALRPGAHLVIVGGGFIGMEIAASARRRGADVTVLEAQPRLLSRVVPEEIAGVMEARHRAEGVAIRCGAAVAAVAEATAGVTVDLADGGALRADFLVVGIGAVANTGLAEAAGLAVDNGIVVDEHLRTSDPHIFAAGDCCAFPLAVYGGRRVRLESWRNAEDQGALAGRNLAGAEDALTALPWFWSDQYDLTLQIAGLPDEGARTVRRDIAAGAFLIFHLAADGRLVAASGIGPGTAVARDIRLAEMLITRRARPDPAQLATPDVKLKSLLAA